MKTYNYKDIIFQYMENLDVNVQLLENKIEESQFDKFKHKIIEHIQLDDKHIILFKIYYGDILNSQIEKYLKNIKTTVLDKLSESFDTNKYHFMLYPVKND